MFIDRERDLAFLERAWSSDQAEFIVVYGRRRVGKTALLRTFCTDRPHTFWVASLSSEALLRQSFTQALLGSPSGGHEHPFACSRQALDDLKRKAHPLIQ